MKSIKITKGRVALLLIILGIISIFSYKYVYNIKEENKRLKEKIGYYNYEVYSDFESYLDSLNTYIGGLILNDDFDKDRFYIFLVRNERSISRFGELIDRYGMRHLNGHNKTFRSHMYEINESLSELCRKDNLDERDIDYLKFVIDFNKDTEDIFFKQMKKYLDDHTIDMMKFYTKDWMEELVGDLHQLYDGMNFDYAGNFVSAEVKGDRRPKSVIKHNLDSREFKNFVMELTEKLLSEEIGISEKENYYSDENREYIFAHNNELYSMRIGKKDYAFGLYFDSSYGEYKLKERKSKEELKALAVSYVEKIGFEDYYLEHEYYGKDKEENIKSADYHFIKKANGVYDNTRIISINFFADGRIRGLSGYNLDLMNEPIERCKLTEEEAVNMIKEEYREEIKEVRLIRDYDGMYKYEVEIQIGKETFVYNINGETGETMNVWRR